jgi:biopolymer transport protein ExbB
MNKHAIMAVAILWLASPLHAQDRIDGPSQPVPAPVQNLDDRGVAPPQAPRNSPGPSVAPTNDARPLLKSAPVALHDLSPWSMFLSADPLVKAVMVSLVFASLVTWTIFLAKSMKLNFARWQLKRSLARISSTGTLAEAQLAVGRSGNVLSSMLAAASQEIRKSADLSSETGIKERVASTFSEILRAEARAVRHGMGLIATIGATSPFVGLFGTVWGIMNSFIGISKSQTTNLAVVAPGIAEALLATACGLAAAIPALFIYNQFTRATRGYLVLAGRASGAVGRLLSRDLDRARGRAYPRAAE